MPSFEKSVYGFSRRLNVLSGVALVLMMVLVFVNVVLRAVWKPILGTYEFTGFLAAITITYALAHCASKKGHIAITIFADRLPLRVQAIINFFIAILAAESTYNVTGIPALANWAAVILP